MSILSLAGPAVFDERSIENPFRMILLFSCVGLLASFAAMAAGVDLSAALS